MYSCVNSNTLDLDDSKKEISSINTLGDRGLEDDMEDGR